MKVIGKICEVLSWFSSLATVVMMVCVLIDVFSRMIFGKPITGLTEIVTMLITCSFASFGATVIANKHVKIDILVNIFPEKVIKVIDFISLLLCFALCVVLAWKTFEHALYAKSMGLGYITLSIPYWPFIMLFAIGFAAGALAIIGKIVMLFKGTPDVPINEVDQILQESKEHDLEQEMLEKEKGDHKHEA